MDPESEISSSLKNLMPRWSRSNVSPLDPRFAASNPAEADEFFSGRKNPEHKSSGRDFKLGDQSLRFQDR